MSFLDSLENNLKNLESADERGADRMQNQARRASEKARALAVAPYAEQLKSAPFTMELLNQVIRVGHESRTKVYMNWLGSTLRLRARDRILELRPAPDGVFADFFEGDQKKVSEPVDLNGDPEKLARLWLGDLHAITSVAPKAFPEDGSDSGDRHGQ
jgi:hypothetical protein